MKFNCGLVLITTLFLISCGRRKPIMGKVIERTEMNNHMLKIKYEYRYEEKYFIDSALIHNKAIVSDIIPLYVDAKMPVKSIPFFDK